MPPYPRFLKIFVICDYYIYMERYDTILYIEPSINESDERYPTTSAMDASWKGKTQNVDWDDPKLWASNAFGRLMQSELNNMGNGFSAEVTDFAKWVVVKINHHNYITGRTSSKTFLVVFKQKNNGIVMSTANKWRSISGYSQAIQYIKAAAQSLKNSNDNKI